MQVKTGECLGSFVGLILCDEFAVMQAPMFDGFLFDPFAMFCDGFDFAEVGISRRDVVQTLMVALMVVGLDGPPDLGF